MKSNQSPVRLEDLLRIKRAEQPPDKFWDQFDRELRAKQLAAIVEPRPWWAPFIRVGARASKFQLPVGAAAVLVVSFITIQGYQSPNSPPASYSAPVASETEMPRLHETVRAVEPTPVSEVVAAPVLAETSSNSDFAEEAASEALSARVPSKYEPGSVSAAPVEPTPSARYIAANLAALQASDPSLVDDAFGASMRRVAGRAPVRDPLTQASATAESRRARLLATALPVSATNSESVVAMSERVSRSLTEERLYDSISRVGVKGDRVAIKF